MTLAEQFQESNGNPIDVFGELAHSIFVQFISPGSIIKVKRISHSPEIVQGLRVKCDTGKLEVNGQALADVILWADNCPDEVAIRFLGESNANLKAWNAWRHNGITQAWLGNAGMRLEHIGMGKVRLKCSDGIGSPDFSDLVVEIEVSSKVPD